MQIKPSASIRQNYNEIADLCRSTGEPVYFTKNGEGDPVVMDIKAFTRRELSVTSGPVNTADYAPRLSLDGQSLFFLRLTDYNCGSLYYQPTAGGPPKELIRGVSGQPGYYGNYYPDWINIYQDQQAIYPSQGEAGEGRSLRF